MALRGAENELKSATKEKVAAEAELAIVQSKLDAMQVHACFHGNFCLNSSLLSRSWSDNQTGFKAESEEEHKPAQFPMQKLEVATTLRHSLMLHCTVNKLEMPKGQALIPSHVFAVLPRVSKMPPRDAVILFFTAGLHARRRTLMRPCGRSRRWRRMRLPQSGAWTRQMRCWEPWPGRKHAGQSSPRPLMTESNASQVPTLF